MGCQLACTARLAPARRLPFFKGKVLGNIAFWAFLGIGVSMIVVLYSRHYCAVRPESCGA